MKRKPIDYYDNKITTLKATIKRLIAERRLAILYERERLAKAILDKTEVIEQTETTGSSKGMFMKLLKIIGVIISFFAALLTCLHLLGWLEPIKAFIYKILLHK